MNTTKRSQRRQRELALFSYRNALDRGDFATVANILAQAEHDPILAQWISEFQTAIESEIAQPSNQRTRNPMSLPNNQTLKLSIDATIPFPSVIRHLTLAVALTALVMIGIILYRTNPNLTPALSSAQQTTSTPTPIPPPARAKIEPQNVGQLALLAEIPGIRLTQIAFSADGTRIAYETAKNEVQVWNITESKVEQSFQVEPADSSGRALAFSPNGAYLAAGTEYYADGYHLWNLLTGDSIRVVASFRPNGLAGKGFFDFLAFSPDSSTLYYLACGHSTDPTATICDRFDVNGFDVTTGERTIDLQFPSGNSVSNPALIPTTNTWAGAYEDGRVILYDLLTGKVGEILTYAAGAGIVTLAASADGTLVATVDSAAQLQIWDTVSGLTKLKAVATSPDHEIRILIFSPDNTLLASRGKPGDTTIQFYSSADGSSVGGIEVTTGLVYALAFSPDGSLLATSSSDGILRLWGLQ